MDANTVITLSENLSPRTAQYLRETFSQIAMLVEQAWLKGDNREEDEQIAQILGSSHFRASLADALYSPTDEQVINMVLGRIIPKSSEVGGTVVPSVFGSALDDVDMGGFDAPSDTEHHASSLCTDCPFRDSCDTYKREGASPLDSEDVRTDALLRFFDSERKPEDMD